MVEITLLPAPDFLRLWAEALLCLGLFGVLALPLGMTLLFVVRRNAGLYLRVMVFILFGGAFLALPLVMLVGVVGKIISAGKACIQLLLCTAILDTDSHMNQVLKSLQVDLESL
jgi:hypothetical protein